MTITTETTRAELNGNGTAGPFQCGFRILNDSDLKVLVGGVLKTLTTHYTVANAGTEKCYCYFYSRKLPTIWYRKCCFKS